MPLNNHYFRETRRPTGEKEICLSSAIPIGEGESKHKMMIIPCVRLPSLPLSWTEFPKILILLPSASSDSFGHLLPPTSSRPAVLILRRLNLQCSPYQLLFLILPSSSSQSIQQTENSTNWADSLWDPPLSALLS